MSDKGWVFFWLILALGTAGATGYAIASGEPWQPFVRGLFFAMFIQQIGLHVRKLTKVSDGREDR